mgnify:CR=1 FL=1
MSFVPYAHNNLYTHLPQNKTFCVKNETGKFNFKTSHLRSREIFASKIENNKFLVFGDSQILGIDWDESQKVKHDLERVLKSRLISIFASPNNGPYQSLSQANEIFKKNNFKNLKEIFFSFNFGNDIFRLQKNWKLKDFVPLKTENLNLIMERPFLYDLVILRGVLSGKYFSINLPDNLDTYNLYKKISQTSKNERVNIWLDKVKIFKKKVDKTLVLITYPPFWIYDKTGVILYEDVYLDYLSLIDKIKKGKIFKKIFIGKTHKGVFLTSDKRHFKTGSILFEISNRS